ncbi:cytochrome P450-like protein [Tribolium castaneum]|uniref:Cytochrome P450-like protein n=2 Tax=Tribolium castaneum TaxID=7070 RepID=D7EJT1_TRICA|nr:PREDICTED: cytochrome P450 6k1 [Tribolium castaneum]EFA12857.1 cytochrome P450-like protein [Tribolium castaneum]|eukprot:XP_970633.1 PREDICTED: cytochrome P450 6k1 [Tribolium castaneum]
MLLTPYLPLDTVVLLSVLALLLYKYFSRNFDHWEKKNVFYFKPIPFFGNFVDISLFRTTIGEHLAKLYNQTTEPFFGIFVFDKPHLIIKSPELVKTILVRDFNNFDDRCIASPHHDPLVKNMLFLNKNPEWKNVRVKMTPVFTTGKLKGMIPLINDVGETMTKYIAQKIPNFSLEAKEICAKFSTDVIAKCAFGINANSFKNEDAEFRKIGRRIFDFRWSTAIQQTSYFFLPGLVNLLKFRMLDKDASDFLRETFWHTIKLREEKNLKANDLIDAIIALKDNQEFCKNMNFEGDKVVAQAAQFFVAGFETTSSTMAFTLYELCLQPQFQRRVRAEIATCLKEHNGLTYEALQSMKYLNMCVCETLRKYPVLPFLDRTCKEDYKLPNSNVVIEKGTPVFIPMFGLHYDPQYFPNPQKYDPERFSDENMQNITPFSYIPFGEGPRNCIGERFGLIGTKLGLIHILSEFEVEKSSDTPVPLEFEPKSFVLASKVGLPMKFKKVMTSAA